MSVCGTGGHSVWREAFLDGLAPRTSVRLLRLGAVLTITDEGFSSHPRLALRAHPVHSMGYVYLPRPLFAHNDRVRCRTLNLLAIAYSLYALGLGPDSP